VYDSGGTAGLRVEVFSRFVRYGIGRPNGQADATQVHSFNHLFHACSRLPPYLADTDGDGTLELIVASELTNSSGAEGTPQIYDVWAWRDGRLDRVGELPAEKVASLNGRTPL
jgi:hypothetical protein